MSTRILYRVIGMWLVIVAAAAVVGLVVGVTPTLGIGVLALVVAVVPPAVVFTLFRRRDTQTISEMLRQ